MYSEDELLPISALQHLVFCERQWGLIHLEQLWTENALTAQGRVMHERVHDETIESRGDLKQVRGLAIRSLSLGLIGKTDLVEFHRLSVDDPHGIVLPNAGDHWQPVPVEFKRGRPKIDRCDEVQLCAQAMCLEEMLEVSIPSGALFYGQPKRRTEVLFDESLRRETLGAITRLHDLTREGKTPSAQFGKKCKSCSLLSQCLPETLNKSLRVKTYIEQSLKMIQQDFGPERL
jgi:CRISPR-associated exonuclease Cas4